MIIGIVFKNLKSDYSAKINFITLQLIVQLAIKIINMFLRLGKILR